MRFRVAYALGVSVVVGAAGLVAAPAHAKAPAGAYDFDGDGRRDLALGSPDGTVGKRAAAGFVTVVYGAKGGPDARRRQVITQATSGVPGAPEAGDRFGASLASADFDRDGYADLAIGAPGEDSAKKNVGTVTILWGSKSGLRGATAWGEGRTAKAGNRFGEALAAGDLQGDGRPELFATIPGTSTFTWLTFSGRKASVRAGGTSKFDVNRSWIATGDVNGDGRGDVVYGWYDHDDPQVKHRRGFTLFKGTAGGGLTRDKTVYTTVHALAVGDFDGDRRADVAVGDTYDSPWNGGSVTVHRGSPFGLGGTYTLHQNSSGVPGVASVEDNFGHSLAAGDVNGDGRADLAVGAPKADSGRVFDAGRAVVLYGSPSGLTGRGSQAIGRSTAGVPGAPRAYEYFGAQVSLLDHNGDGRADLTAGTPNLNAPEGGVTTVLATKTGLTPNSATVLTPRTLGIPNRKANLGATLGG
ncbi:FG-GAP-like repeat-containing protein [Actinomadura flavalba]|uniref:FG-GAP-like repeat-containing protein n=1 Tax=Actinomadura flavalba TaxID=1120938 RepID=UPI00037CA299|nr:FG-GAP-like repeat-containing protein [Actinomadura flavalba]